MTIGRLPADGTFLPATGDWIVRALLAQRGHLFPWVPVMLGLGIWVYFMLPAEPHGAVVALALAGAVGAGVAVRPAGEALGIAIMAAGLVATGFAMGALRAQVVAAPVLEWRYYGPVEGRIVEIDRSSRDLPRVTLDRVVLEGIAPEATPRRVRISVYGEQPWLPEGPGAVVMMTAHLAPPNGPAEPGAFDFRRLAWFSGLGAVGYVRTPVLRLLPPEEGWGLRVARLRAGLADTVMARIPGDAGGLAAAMMTGDRSGLTEAANAEMRAANLYHLVSISGTHMAMLVAFVFGLVRYGVALVPPLALRVSAKKVAAAIALPVAAGYLVLAGRDMATERAFVMVAVMLVAVLLDRQAITLRSVAIAALIVLGARPEALINPGFQMSFAASLALVVVFSQMSGVPRQGRMPRWLGVVGLVLLSSLVAGLATAPFAAAHFNRIAHYGLVANLLATPAMAILVMPGAVGMALLGPIGLDQPAVWMVEWGCRFILGVAEAIAALPGAETAVRQPSPWVLPLIALGGLWLCLWQGRGRWAGIVGPLAAVLLWAGTDRPAVLIAPGGGLVGIAGPEGRALNTARSGAYVAETWIANDGEAITQEAAAARSGWSVQGRIARAEAAGLRILWAGGVRALAEVDGCGGADVLVTSAEAGEGRPCIVIDAKRLEVSGAVAIDADARLRTASQVAGRRLWTGGAAVDQ
jgi:competence protein ComEC